MRNNVCARKMKSQTENIMKQFNLEEYLANPSKKVVTRDGRSVRIVCTDRVLGTFPVLALVMEKSGIENSYSYKTNGQYNEQGISNLDLFFASEKHEGWLNIYKAGVHRETLVCMVNRYVGSSIWPTEEAAKAAADADPVTTIKIEWEE